jgi:integrative and conjugative element protein (TIGR02256 family)
VRASDHGGLESEGGPVWLAAAALALMLAEASSREPLETGGMLLGWQGDEDGSGIVIARVLGPGPRATHRRTRFVPDGRWQRRELAEAYERSGRVLRYVGDWHSHPGGGSTPSARDLRTAKKIARKRSARAPAPLTLILAGSSEREWRPRAHRLIEGRLAPVECITTASLPHESDPES